MKLKSLLLEAARWVVAVGALVYLVILLGGNAVSTAEFADVEKAVLAQTDTANMVKAENQMVKRLYGLDPNEFEGCRLYYPASNMDAEELLLIKLRDPVQGEQVRDAMESRLQTQKNSFEGYGIEQFDLLSNCCVLQVRGNYALFAVSQTHSDVLRAFEDAL